MEKISQIIVFGIVGIFLFGIVFGFVVNAEEGDGLGMNVSIMEPVMRIEIGNESLDLGETTQGYRTTLKNTTLKNIGDLRISITATLPNESDYFFNYLRLNTHLGCTNAGWRSVGNFSRILDSPSTYKGDDGEMVDLCTRLDLTDYEGTIEEDHENLSTELTFWITAA